MVNSEHIFKFKIHLVGDFKSDNSIEYNALRHMTMRHELVYTRTEF